MGPAQTTCTGCALKRNEVTTPKLPPPPRIAQNRSGFLLRAGDLESSVREDHIRGQQVVDGQAVLAREMAHAAAQREPAHTGGGDDSGGHGQPKRMHGMIDIAPGAAAADAHRARGRIDMNKLDGGEIDYQAIVADSQPAGVMAAAANRNLQTLVCGRSESTPSHRRRRRTLRSCCGLRSIMAL